MRNLRFDIYPADDPVDGTRLVALTREATADTNGFMAGTTYRHSLRDLGNGGTIVIHSDDPAVQAGYLAADNYVRVVDRGLNEVIGGFFLAEGEEKVLSRDEQGGEVLSFGGPGAMEYLARANFPKTIRSPFDPNLALHQDFIDANGYLRFGGPETYGGILGRVIEEAKDDIPSAIPDVGTRSWIDTEDSGGTPWPEFDGYYDIQIGENVLTLVADLMDKGIDFFLNADTFEPDAYIAGTYGTDRTSATFAAGKIRFEAGINIAADLDKAIHRRAYVSHMLVIGQDRITFVEVVDPDWSSGETVVRGTLHVDSTNDPDVLEDAGLEGIRLRKLAADMATFPTDAASSTHRYTPGPPTGAGHFWVGDYVTLHTGTGEHDYNEQTIQVAAIEWRMTEAGVFEVWVELGAQYLSRQAAAAVRNITTLIEGPGVVQLCQPGELAVASTVRMYYSNTTSGLNATAPTVDAGWDELGVTGVKQLTTVPDGTFGATGGPNSEAGDVDGGSPVDVLLGRYAIQMDSSMAALLAAGGATIRSQLRARSRFGIGINEAGQNLIGQLKAYVTQGASSTIRGTALSLHGLTSSAGSTKWPAQSTLVNRVIPPAAATSTLSAVSGATSGDYFVIEMGYRSFSDTTTGGRVHITNDQSSDLPEDESTTDVLNAWVEIGTAGGDALTTVNDGHPLLIGEGTRAKRCGDTEHFFATRAPTIDDDFDTAGMRYGTHWVWVDDVDDPTESFGSWMLTDPTEGAAVWIQISSGTSGTAHTHDQSDIVSIVIDHEDMGAAEDFDASLSQDHEGLITEAVTITLSGATDGEAAWLSMRLVGGTGAPYAITWPASVSWPGGVAPESPGEDEVLRVALVSYDGGSNWEGSYPGIPESTSLDVSEDGGGTSVSGVSELQFEGDDFDVTDLGAGAAKVSLIAAGSGGGGLPLTAVIDGEPVLLWDENNSLIGDA